MTKRRTKTEGANRLPPPWSLEDERRQMGNPPTQPEAGDMLANMHVRVKSSPSPGTKEPPQVYSLESNQLSALSIERRLQRDAPSYYSDRSVVGAQISKETVATKDGRSSSVGELINTALLNLNNDKRFASDDSIATSPVNARFSAVYYQTSSSSLDFPNRGNDSAAGASGVEANVDRPDVSQSMQRSSKSRAISDPRDYTPARETPRIPGWTHVTNNLPSSATVRSSAYRDSTEIGSQ